MSTGPASPVSPVSHVVPAEHAQAFRQFNRFHTRLVGALAGSLLRSGLALPQARLLYELAQAPADGGLTASRLAQGLGLNPGYLSRLITGLEADGLLLRRPAPDHARRLVLALTPRGRRVFRQLDAASAAEAASRLAGLSAGEQASLVGAMARVRRLLGDTPGPAAITLREPLPGDFGAIVHHQGRLYAREHGWDLSFEALVAEIIGKFGRDFLPGRERCWVADREGEVVGSVFVVQAEPGTAQLRLLFVDPSARGQGLGRRLVDECLAFARQAGYRRMVLWTNDVLVSARRIYQAAGFQLVAQAPHHAFGKDLVGQHWALDL